MWSQVQETQLSHDVCLAADLRFGPRTQNKNSINRNILPSLAPLLAAQALDLIHAAEPCERMLYRGTWSSCCFAVFVPLLDASKGCNTASNRTWHNLESHRVVHYGVILLRGSTELYAYVRYLSGRSELARSNRRCNTKREEWAHRWTK